MRFLAAFQLSALLLTAGDLRLLDAVKRRDTPATELLLRQKADVNSSATDGGTPLAWAVYLGVSCEATSHAMTGSGP